MARYRGLFALELPLGRDAQFGRICEFSFVVIVSLRIGIAEVTTFDFESESCVDGALKLKVISYISEIVSFNRKKPSVKRVKRLRGSMSSSRSGRRRTSPPVTKACRSLGVRKRTSKCLPPGRAKRLYRDDPSHVRHVGKVAGYSDHVSTCPKCNEV